MLGNTENLQWIFRFIVQITIGKSLWRNWTVNPCASIVGWKALLIMSYILANSLTWHDHCRTQSIFGDTVYLCYCKLRLVTPLPPFLPMTGLRGRKIFSILVTLEVLKVLKLLLKNVEEILFGQIFFGCLYSTNSNKACLGSPVTILFFSILHTLS